MIRTAFVLSLLALAPRPPQADQATIRPWPTGQPIHVRQIENSSNVLVYNDTLLWLSARFTNADTGDVLVPHVTTLDAITPDPNAIPPQSGSSKAYSATEKAFNEPRGRNCRIDIISPGGAGFGTPTDEEQSLRNRMLVRALAEQIALPILNGVSGMDWGGDLKRQLLLNALSEAFAQNHQFLSDAWACLQGKDEMGFLTLCWNTILRDIDGGGPIYNAIWNIAKVNIKKKIAEYTARRIATKWIPFVNAIDLTMQIWNWGPTGVGIMNVIHDLVATPWKQTFLVFFNPGVGSIEPTTVRTDGRDKIFTIRGHKLDDVRRRPVINFHDRTGSLFFTRPPFEIANDGDSMKVRIPGPTLAALEGFITCSVTFGRQTIRLPERIQLINTLRITRLIPARGHPGQQIEIRGDDLSPFTITNKVFFRSSSGERAPARLVVAGPAYLRVIVPALSEGQNPCDVWVEESYGSTRRESNTLPFTREDGTLADADAKHRDGLMKERELVFEGTLDAATPEADHEFGVPAGMQVVAELESVAGNGAILESWALRRKANSVGHHRGPIRAGQPGQRLQHTSDAVHRAAPYSVVLRRQAGTLTYRVRVNLVRRDDLASGADAGWRQETPLVLPPGGPYDAHLFAEPNIPESDTHDTYLIPDVPPYEQMTVTLSSIAGDRARLAGIDVWRLRNGRVERCAEHGELESRDLPLTIRDTDNESRSYLMTVRHARGLVTYRLSLDIGHVGGPALRETPIRSDFNQGSAEGWTVAGNFALTPQPAQYERAGTGNGYIAAREYDGASGPLDIVFVVDTTSSMGGAIGSVKEGARDIVAELKRRSTHLRVGVVSFKDGDAEGEGLSEDADARMATLGGWSATGGGDIPEDALAGVHKALSMDWRSDAEVARVIVLITDAPFRLDANGRDYANRTIASIAADARKLGARVYPLPTSKDATLSGHASQIASATRGRVLSGGSAEETAALIIGAVEYAVDRVSPRMFVAPAKFLGDVSRYLDTTLAYDIRGADGRDWFSAPDVVLTGGDRTLTFSTLIQPGPYDFDSRRQGMHRIVIPLSERGHWIVKETGRRATRADLQAALAGLRDLKIRGEYRSGAESINLDNVVLGAVEDPTDLGLSDADLEWVEWLARRETVMGRNEAAYRERYDSPIDLLRETYHAAGIRDSTSRAMMDAWTLSKAVMEGVRRIYTIERDRIRRATAEMRRRGGPTAEERRAWSETTRQWDERQRHFVEYVKTLVEQMAVVASADELLYAGNAENTRRQGARKEAAEREIARITAALKGE